MSYTSLGDAKFITYRIQLPTTENKIGFNLIGDDDFKTPYILDTIYKYPEGKQILTQATIYFFNICINIKYLITAKGGLEK